MVLKPRMLPLALALVATACAKPKGGSSGEGDGATTTTEQTTEQGGATETTDDEKKKDDDTKKEDEKKGDDKEAEKKAKIVSNVDTAIVTTPAVNLTIPGSLNLMPFDDECGAGLNLTDLEAAEKQIWAYDPAMDPLKLASYTLCLLSETQYNAHTNLAEHGGAYLAKVPFKKCDNASPGQGEGTASAGGGQGSQSSTPQSADFLVLSTKGESTPLVAKFVALVPEEKYGLKRYVEQGKATPMARLYAFLKVAAAPSDLNPFGSFILSYVAFALDDAGVEGTNPIAKGTIEIQQDATSGDPRLSFYQKDLQVQTWGADTWTTSIVNQATANLKVGANEAAAGFVITDGAAKTATNYEWSYSGPNVGTASYSGQSNSGHNVLAYDRQNRLTRWTAGDNNNKFWGTFDPEAPTCQKRTPRLIPMNFTPFKANGSVLNHTTNYSFEAEGTDAWGFKRRGWLGNWGPAWLSGAATAGETVTVYKGGDKVQARFYPLQGSLYETTGGKYEAVTLNLASTTLVCDSSCLDATAGSASGSQNYAWTNDGTNFVLKHAGTAIAFPSSGADYQWAQMSLHTADNSRTFSFNMSKNQWGAEGYLRLASNNAILTAPAPLAFSERPIVLTDFATGHEKPELVGQNFFATLSYSSTPSDYYGWWYNPVKWEMSDVKDQFNNNLWLPAAILGTFKLTAANTTGDVVAGDEITFAPLLYQASPVYQALTDCSEDLTSRIEAAEAFTLLDAVPEARADVKGLIGTVPSSDGLPLLETGN